MEWHRGNQFICKEKVWRNIKIKNMKQWNVKVIKDSDYAML